MRFKRHECLEFCFCFIFWFCVYQLHWLNELTALLIYLKLTFSMCTLSSYISRTQLCLALRLGNLQRPPFLLCILCGNHGNSPNCSICTFLPQCVNQLQYRDNIKYSMYTQLWKETCSYYLYSQLKKGKVSQHVEYFMLIQLLSDREKGLKFRVCLEASTNSRWTGGCLLHLKVLFDVISHSITF